MLARVSVPRALGILLLLLLLLFVYSSPDSVWQGDRAVSSPGDACIMKDISRGGSNYRMCLRDNDILSDIIRRKGFWYECDALLAEWRKGAHDATGRTDVFFVDAGANIGSCSMLMASNGVPTRSFEPSASNLFFFTSSLLASPTAKSKTTVHMVGLGEKPSSHTLYSQLGNKGNSVVDVAVRDYDSANMTQQTIHIRRLDEILWPHSQPLPPLVPVMKMDVQGYEVKLLMGAKRLLEARAIKSIKTELAAKWLIAQGTSPRRLCALLQFHGFNIFNGNNGKPMTLDDCEETAKHDNGICDVWARLRPM